MKSIEDHMEHDKKIIDDPQSNPAEIGRASCRERV